MDHLHLSSPSDGNENCGANMDRQHNQTLKLCIEFLIKIISFMDNIKPHFFVLTLDHNLE